MTKNRIALIALILAAFGLNAPASRALSPERENYVMPQVTYAASDSIGYYGITTTTNNACNITFTNYGSWGIGLTSAVYPNFRYPAGTKYEHLAAGMDGR